MFNEKQFRKEVVIPSLASINYDGVGEREAVIATIAQESLGGTYLVQLKGPAKGIIQMEPNTYNDIWNKFILKNRTLELSIYESLNKDSQPDFEELVYNLRLNVIMCILHYARYVNKFPKDLENIWELYKLRYNTPQGKAVKDDFIRNYRNFIGGKK